MAGTKQKAKDVRKLSTILPNTKSQGTTEVCVCETLSQSTEERGILFVYILHTKSKSFPQADYYWHNIQLNVSLMTLSFWDSEVTSLFSSLEVPPFCAFPPIACLRVKSRDLHVTHSSHVFPTVIKHPDLLKTI